MARLVCVLSPYRESAARSRKRHHDFAKILCQKATYDGFAPFASHLYGPVFLDEDVPADRAAGIAISKSIIARCDEVWVWDLWGITSGMKDEIGHAENCNALIARCGTPPEIVIRYMSKAEIPSWDALLEVA